MSPSRRLATAAVLALAGLAARDAHSRQEPKKEATPRPPMSARPVHAAFMTLKELTDESDRIFLGRVADIEPQEAQLVGKGGRAVSVRAYEVTFEVIRKYKGDVEVGRPLRVRQLASAYIPLRKGEEVLWYLSKPGKSGFTAPMAQYSGHFKVFDNPRLPGTKSVVNLVRNEGLWSQKAPLIGSAPGLDGARFADALKRKSDLNPEGIRSIIALAEQPNRPGPLPLELVSAATESLLSRPD